MLKLNPIGQNVATTEINGVEILFSYSAPVAFREGGKCYRSARFYSKTTSRHIADWLDGDTAERIPENAIKAKVQSVEIS